MKDTKTGENLDEMLSTSLEWHKLSWNKIISVTTHRTPSLRHKPRPFEKDVSFSRHNLIGKYCLLLYYSLWVALQIYFK
jgi:hypothetical protein